MITIEDNLTNAESYAYHRNSINSMHSVCGVRIHKSTVI